MSSLYSSLHNVKPNAVLFTGFPTSKSTNTSCPKSVVDAGESFKEDGDSDRISFIDSLVLPVTNLLLLNNAHEDKVKMKFG